MGDGQLTDSYRLTTLGWEIATDSLVAGQVTDPSVGKVDDTFGTEVRRAFDPRGLGYVAKVSKTRYLMVVRAVLTTSIGDQSLSRTTFVVPAFAMASALIARLGHDLADNPEAPKGSDLDNALFAARALIVRECVADIRRHHQAEADVRGKRAPWQAATLLVNAAVGTAI